MRQQRRDADRRRQHERRRRDRDQQKQQRRVGGARSLRDKTADTLANFREAARSLASARSGANGTVEDRVLDQLLANDRDDAVLERRCVAAILWCDLRTTCGKGKWGRNAHIRKNLLVQSRSGAAGHQH